MIETKKWTDRCKEEAMALTQKKRQEFLDLMWEGKTIKQASEGCGISSDAGSAIILMNIKTRKFLNKESE